MALARQTTHERTHIRGLEVAGEQLEGRQAGQRTLADGLVGEGGMQSSRQGSERLGQLWPRVPITTTLCPPLSLPFFSQLGQPARILLLNLTCPSASTASPLMPALPPRLRCSSAGTCRGT